MNLVLFQRGRIIVDKNMFNKKFKDIEELRKRQELINQHLIIAGALKNDLQNWINAKLKEYGMPEGKLFNIEMSNGVITERDGEQK